MTRFRVVKIRAKRDFCTYFVIFSYAGYSTRTPKRKLAYRSKRAPTTLGQQVYPRNRGHPRHFQGNIMGYASHSHINDCLSNQILLAFSLYDLRCRGVAREFRQGGARPNFPIKGCGLGDIFSDKGVAHVTIDDPR